MKPEIRFKEFTNAWEQRKFGDCVLIQRGGSPRPIENYITKGEEGINWVKIGDVSADSRYITCTKEKIIPEGEKFSRRVQIGDLILSNSMSFGRPYIMAVDGCIHDGWLLIRDNNNLFYQEYLLQLLSSNYMYSQYRSLASGGVVNNLNSDLVQSITALIPNKEEQSKLGAFFRNLDNLIALHQRKCDKLKNVKKSLLEKMFPAEGKDVPEIRFKEFTDAWEQRKLGDMGSTFTGLSGKTKEDFGHGDAKFITYMNVFSNPIADLQMTETVEIDSKQNCVKAGDVFFTTSSETPEEVGMSCVMPENAENTYLNSFCFGYRPTEKFDLNYIAYVLRSKSFRKEMKFLAQGISRYNISKSKVMEVAIPVPSLDEQRKVGQYFSNLDNLITLHQRKCEKLKNIKKALLEKMFC